MKKIEIWIAVISILVIAGVGLWAVLSGQNQVKEENLTLLDGKEILVLLDGQELTEKTVSPGKGDGLRVVVTKENEVLADLPFGEEHTLEVIQKGGRNKIRITANSVYMEDADCQGQDCVKMTEITRDNLETRVLRDMIICLPHKITVQVTEQY